MSVDLSVALARSKQTSSVDLDLEADAKGVTIELHEPALRFHHSFVSGAIARRSRQSNQALIKACHNKQQTIHQVLDVTAGWGSDGLTLARHGQQITLLEKDPLIYAILRYSLDQLTNADQRLAAQLSLRHIDAEQFLICAATESNFDCIYLDPMFPTRKSSAKPAKEMQILQRITDNCAIESCFELALQKASKRVVVKRPSKAPKLNQRQPDLVYREKSIRFDVYLTR